MLGDGVLLRFDERLRGALRPESFSLLVDDRLVLAKKVVVSGRNVRLVLPTAVYRDDAVGVYWELRRVKAAERLRDAAGNPVASFAADAVNRGPVGCADQLGAVKPAAFSEGPTDASYFLPSTGRYTITAFGADFADSATRPPPGFLGSSVAVDPAVPAWFAAASYGRLELAASPALPIVRLAKEAKAYGVRQGVDYATARPFLQEAVSIAATIADLSGTSAVVISIRGLQSPLPEAVLVAPPGQGVIADGREIRAFVLASGGGIVYSTTAKALRFAMGVPSLAGSPSISVSPWDTDARGGSRSPTLPLAWHSRKLGWIDPSQVRCVRHGSAEVTLDPSFRSGGVKLVLAPTGPTSAVAVELRRKGGPDADQCFEGVIAYEIQTAGDVDPPFANPAIRLATVRPPFTWTPGSPYCVPMANQVLDVGGVTQARVGPVTIEVLSRAADGSTTVRISR